MKVAHNLYCLCLLYCDNNYGGLYEPTESLVACMNQQNHCGGLYGLTKSLWWPVWTNKITVVVCMDPKITGGLYSPTKSLWWPVWSHKITVVACMDPQNHCGGLYGPTKSLWWPVVPAASLCLLNPLSYINILIKHCINLVMHYKFEILWGGECKTWNAFHINI